MPRFPRRWSLRLTDSHTEVILSLVRQNEIQQRDIARLSGAITEVVQYLMDQGHDDLLPRVERVMTERQEEHDRLMAQIHANEKAA